MPDILPTHPFTGLKAVGIVGGRPVWPIRGGSTPEPPPNDQETAPPAGAPPATEPLGEGGKSALDAERKARAAAEKAQKAAEKAAEDARKKLQAIEDKDKTELERIQARNAELEKNYATEMAQRLRLQVATQHSIGPDDLVLLTGATEEELTAQATRIAALNGTRAAATAPPTFAPSTGQQAGNGTPVAPTATVTAGRELYRKNKQPTA